MQRTTLYHLSMGTAGLFIGLVGARTVFVKGITPGAGLMVLGGGGMFLFNSLRVVRASSSEFEPGNFVWIAVIGAILSLLGMVLLFVQ